jgi:AmmeMemoRadiSam system protein A
MKTEHQDLLLEIARDAIFQCLETGRPGGHGVFQSLEEKFPTLGNIPELQEKRATFVTLTINGDLRGCIGMLEACRPLAEDVAANACAAAFEDPRFEPLSQKELERTDIHISVLSAPEELEFSSEADLLAQIRPGVDGLILQDGCRRGTFLPSVWEELPDQDLFLMHLKMKAGLPNTYWSDTLRIFRYTAEYFPG